MDPISILELISAISPAVTGLIQDAEGIFGSGSGQQKQQFVVGAIGNALQGVVTGAQAAGASGVISTVQKLTPALPSIVNMFVAAANAVGLLGKPASTATASATPAAVAPAPTGQDVATAIPGFPTAQ